MNRKLFAGSPLAILPPLFPLPPSIFIKMVSAFQISPERLSMHHLVHQLLIAIYVVIDDHAI